MRSVAIGIRCEGLELLLAARVAEYGLMSGRRKDRSELAAHQSGTPNANSHAALPGAPYPLPVSDRSFARCARDIEPHAP